MLVIVGVPLFTMNMLYFFVQAEDGIRDHCVTGVQTCALPISCLEPMGCTAIVKDGRVDVWTSTQNAEASLAVAAGTAGVPLENVEVHRVQLGGGFGRRGGAQDFVRQGVAIAKAMEGTPVKMLLTRDEWTQQ